MVKIHTDVGSKKRLEEYLVSLSLGSVKDLIMPFLDSISLHINLNITFLSNAWKVGKWFTNNLLALSHLGYLNRILRASLCATFIWFLFPLLWLHHSTCIHWNGHAMDICGYPVVFCFRSCDSAVLQLLPSEDPWSQRGAETRGRLPAPGCTVYHTHSIHGDARLSRTYTHTHTHTHIQLQKQHTTTTHTHTHILPVPGCFSLLPSSRGRSVYLSRDVHREAHATRWQ